MTTSYPTTYRLSKSKFLSGLQCPKRLYLQIHSPELASDPDAALQAILDMGTEVGEFARQRCPGGVLVDADHRHAAEALSRTAELIADPAVPAIYEAAFQFDNVLVRVDILERVRGEAEQETGWRLIEVKSSTKVKDVHLDDLAIQSHVLLGAGVALLRSCLMHVNTRYVYQGGDPAIDELFEVEDLTGPVACRRIDVSARLALMKLMLAEPVSPVIEPDSHCQTPYECPFWSHCTKEKPSRWIFYLPGGGRAVEVLARKGIGTIDDIPDDVTLSPVQRRMKENVEWISPKLKTHLQTVTYPVHHLDFETAMLPVPKYPMTRPYQTIPVQWSNHIETESGELTHHEYLHAESNDPRHALTVALLESLQGGGSICVYSGYERSILERLAEALPTLQRELTEVIDRLWDLFPIIKDHYYHPSFAGSFSIKSVLPAVIPSMGYDDLEIRDGGFAANQYHRMIFVETDWIEKLKIQEALLQYCARDTLAMVELRRSLLKKCSDCS